MSTKSKLPRRQFLKGAAGVVGAATQVGYWPALASTTHTAGAQPNQPAQKQETQDQTAPGVTYPRVFRDRQLKMISFPLGGVGAGSIGLGGLGLGRRLRVCR